MPPKLFSCLRSKAGRGFASDEQTFDLRGLGGPFGDSSAKYWEAKDRETKIKLEFDLTSKA